MRAVARPAGRAIDAAPSRVRDPRARRGGSTSPTRSAGSRSRRCAAASSIADVGAGAGFPGLALAAALPEARRRPDRVDRAQVRVHRTGHRVGGAIAQRPGRLPPRGGRGPEAGPPRGGREAHDAVTARAVGRLATVAELASPLLVEGGVLVAWKGRRDSDEELELDRAADAPGDEPADVAAVGPYAGSREPAPACDAKARPDARGLPRRPGMAKKRPFGSQA